MTNANMKNIVAVDFDNSAIKVVVGDMIKNEISIKKLCQTSLPENVIIDGKIMNQAIVEDSLKELLKTNAIKNGHCFATFESSNIISREVIVPSNQNANFQEMAKYEMAQFLPVEMSNYIVQSKKIKEVEVDQKPFIEALSTAIPKAIVDQYFQVIQNSGLKPAVLDTYSNSIAKLFEVQGRINEETIADKVVAVLEFAYDSMLVVIFQNGQFKLSRLIVRGIKELDANISRFMGVTIEDASKLKMSIKNIMDYSAEKMDDEARMANVTRSTLEAWFEEIEKVFRYYASRNKGNEQIDNIFISGSIADIKGADEFIGAYFRTKAKKMESINGILWPDKEQPKDFAEYLHAIGAMYRR